MLVVVLEREHTDIRPVGVGQELAQRIGELEGPGVQRLEAVALIDLRNRRQELRLVVTPQSFVGEVLAAVSMDQSIPIDPALDDALRAVGAGNGPD